MAASQKQKIGIIGAGLIGRYGAAYRRMAEAQPNAQGWSAALVATVEAERRVELPADKLGARQAWRDRRLAALIARKRAQDKKRD
jgi:predicted dehydrogenase